MLSRLILALSLLVVPAAATEVDVELMLAVDVSYSMTPNELEIQRRGYAEALRDPAIMEAIETGYRQKVALSYVEWSGKTAQRIIVPWTLIESQADLDRFAGKLTAEFQPILRRTSISGVLDFAPLWFEASDFKGDRRVIDVSGDGPNNMGRPVAQARDALLAAGFAINGLPLMTREHVGGSWRFHLEDLDLYYQNCVIGGMASFMIPVKSWEEFPAAVRRKLVLELAGRVPEARIWRAEWRGAQPGGGYDCLIGEKMWLYFMQNYQEW
ncbi:MAG: DUF1194 domain-containing protein [Pseudomonadota bacterium]